MAPKGEGWTGQPWWVRGRQTRQGVLDAVTSRPVKKERKRISDTRKSKSHGTDTQGLPVAGSTEEEKQGSVGRDETGVEGRA